MAFQWIEMELLEKKESFWKTVWVTFIVTFGIYSGISSQWGLISEMALGDI